MKNMIITRWLAKIRQAVKYYVIFSKAIPFIFVLILVHSWIEYGVIAAVITHLTEDDWLQLPKAASIVNVHDGVTAAFVPLVAYASDAYLGPFMAVVCTNVAFIFGLVLLFFAAWRMQTIELQLLYIALLFVAIGRAGRDITLKEFLANQFRKDPVLLDEKQIQSRRKVWWRSSYILGIIASLFVLTTASWVKLCNISTIALAIAFIFFLGGIPFFEYKAPTEGSSLNKVVRVFYAAILKSHLSLNSSTLFSVTDHPPILNIPMLRWLDKASIVEPSPRLEEQEKKARLCTIEEVQEVKCFLKMIPLWTTFLVYGLLQATGDSFFYEQVGYMDSSLGSIEIPIIIFVIIEPATSFIVTRFCDSFLFSSTKEIPRHVMLVRIGIGMAISPLLCVIAWRIENYRKHQKVIMKNEISVFWLVPQFFLLGFMEGLVLDGLEEFFYVQIPKSMKIYGPPFTVFALNIGNFLGVPVIMIFRGLFTDDLDTSKLGEYYAILACICIVNLVFYCFVATYYVKGEESPDEDRFETELMRNVEELDRDDHLQIELSDRNL